MKMIKCISIILFCVVFSGLTALPLDAQLADGRDDPHSKWMKSVISNRQEKNQDFKSLPTSPMAAIDRYTMKNTRKEPIYVFRAGLGKVMLLNKEEPGIQVVIKRKDGQWIWEKRNDDVHCVSGKQQIESGKPLTNGALLRSYRWSIKAYLSKDSITFIVFNLELPAYRQFSNLLYYPPNMKYRFNARLEKFAKPDTVVMLTSQNLKKTYYRYGYIHFKLDGKDLKLTAYKFKLKGKNSDYLFIPFGDATNGEETYGSGRFLEITEPKSNWFEFDMNLNFNPLCNYSGAYNCPLPPRENILNVPIRAGELTYPTPKAQKGHEGHAH